MSRNPCFSGQCFAILVGGLTGVTFKGRNPCFSGQCFAMKSLVRVWFELRGRNPCFSGQCFALLCENTKENVMNMSQSLF